MDEQKLYILKVCLDKGLTRRYFYAYSLLYDYIAGNSLDNYYHIINGVKNKELEMYYNYYFFRRSKLNPKSYTVVDFLFKKIPLKYACEVAQIVLTYALLKKDLEEIYTILRTNGFLQVPSRHVPKILSLAKTVVEYGKEKEG